MRTARRPVRVLWFFALGALLWGAEAVADHSLGRPCLDCHQLRSTNVKAGTRNIKRSLIDARLPYAANWYCSGLTSNTDPRAPLTGAFLGGNPLDCTYCHGGTLDIGLEFFEAVNRVKKQAPELTASGHPVESAGATYTWEARRIACNQCHNAEVTAESTTAKELCVKTPGAATGYPNHRNLSAVTQDTGLNQRTGAAAHLRLEYGPTAGSNWTSTANILCFDCHRSGSGDPLNIDVKTDYDKVRGGHNILGIGSLASKKLPCYNCHDAHAVLTNAKLIIEAKVKRVGPTTVDVLPHNPYSTSYVTGAPPTGFDGSNDRVVCGGCHGGGYVVEGVTLPNVLAATGWTPSAFPFHADVHKEVGGTPWAGNCLQKNSGCHQSAHNTDIYRCLDCHSRVVTDAMAAEGKTVPGRLLIVNHIDSEFGHIGDIGAAGTVNSTTANYIQSAHSIPYKAKVFTIAKTPAQLVESPPPDMSLPADNGCLYCHFTTGKGANVIVSGAGGSPSLTGSRGNAFANRRDLEHFDPFCLSCHDNAGDSFVQASNYEFNNGSTGKITFTGRTMLPPRVSNETAMGNGYHYAAGHGRGLTGAPSTRYPSGLANPTTENEPANIPCLECHLYHGSTAPKLLPGWRETEDGSSTASNGGHVIKGGHAGNRTGGYRLKPSGKASTGAQHSIGGFRYSTAIDYTDYTKPNPGNSTKYDWTYSDYRNSTPWSSYGHTNTPDGVATPFGTAGDVFQEACGVIGTSENTTSYAAAGNKQIGFCNVCHQFRPGNFSSGGTDGTTTAYDVAYTHQGTLELDCNSKAHQSDRIFRRDCLECHDPHGSGTGSSGTNGVNLFMIRQRMKNTATTWTNVVLTSREGAGSFDPDDSSNSDDLCNVCHTQATHSNLTSGGTNAHLNGQNCLANCHRHAAEAP